MDYRIAVKTDVGIKKETNQDGCCIKQAQTDKGTVIFAVLCDGMGGLSKGEVASANLIKAFAKWFENDYPKMLLKGCTVEDIRLEWSKIIEEQNQNIAAYGDALHIQLGTTATALLITEDGSYIIGHVGDSRAYLITDESIEQLTEDQSFVAREVKMGRMTPQEALTDSRRNVLLQCVGASTVVEPAFYFGNACAGQCFMLCSDGFRHAVSVEEIQQAFAPSANNDEKTTEANIEQMIELNISRGETDNITAVLIYAI